MITTMITPFSQILRKSLAHRAPRLLALVRTYRTRWMFTRHAAFQREIAHKLYGSGAIHVLSGPFAGMRYLDVVVHGCITPRWIGSMESELHETVEEAIIRAPRVVINVGSAEGYYAVGFARRLPGAQVFAFDVDPWGRRTLKELAALNGATNLHISSWCRHDNLQRLLREGHGLVWCDIEGGEYGLLDAIEVPALAFSDLIVELHATDTMNIDDGEALFRTRFSATHFIDRIPTGARNVADWQTLTRGRLTDDELRASIDEHRGGSQKWLVMWAKRDASSADPTTFVPK
jgi:hypothetical protein